MTFSQIFVSLFTNPKSKPQCQPTASQQHQNSLLSKQLQSLSPQSILHQQGKLDPRYQKVIEQANIQSTYRIEKYMQQYRNLLQNVDKYCNQNRNRKYNEKIQCVQEMDGLILERFERPFIRSQLNLYKVANACLIRGEQINNCIEEVKKENLKSLQDGLKSLKELVKSNCS